MNIKSYNLTRVVRCITWNIKKLQSDTRSKMYYIEHVLNIYKSTGPDMLHPRILRALEDKLARPLTHIFNNSVETGIIPEEWKSAT